MRYLVTPLCMTQSFFRDTGGYAGVGERSDYEERQDITVEASSPSAAAEQAWTIYQNINDNHLCPDGGRSMMVGDLVRVQREGYDSLWECRSVGFRPLPDSTLDRFRESV